MPGYPLARRAGTGGAVRRKGLKLRGTTPLNPIRGPGLSVLLGVRANPRSGAVRVAHVAVRNRLAPYLSQRPLAGRFELLSQGGEPHGIDLKRPADRRVIQLLRPLSLL